MNCSQCGKRMKGSPDDSQRRTFFTCACGGTATYEWDAPQEPARRSGPRSPAKRHSSKKDAEQPKEDQSPLSTARLQVLLFALGGLTPHGEPVSRAFVDQRLSNLMDATPDEIATIFPIAKAFRMVIVPETGFVKRIGAVPMFFAPKPEKPSVAESSRTLRVKQRWRGIRLDVLQDVIDQLSGVAKMRTVVPRWKVVRSLMARSSQSDLVVRASLSLAIEAGMIEVTGNGKGATLFRLTPPFDVSLYVNEDRVMRRYKVQGPGCRWVTRD